MRTITNNKYIVLVILILSVTSVSFTIYDQEQKLIEDIYTHTDRSFYFPGETIWFKSYVVDTDHNITTLSDVMYAELISPKGTVIEQLKIRINQGYAYGNFDTKEEWAGGGYTLKMYTHWMRNYGEEIFFTKKLTIQKVVQPNVLFTLKFEKEGYGKGAEVVADFKVKDLKNKPLSNKELRYEVAVKGEKIISDKFSTDAKGVARPRFMLPMDLSTADVVFTVLMPYNGTTESISRSVPVILDTIDLQFFPESGNIIAGATNQVAFKALNEFGKPVDLSGEIIDSNNEIITQFKSYHDGMGGFSLLAQSNVKYYARITSPFTSKKKLPLPLIKEKGVTFSATTDSTSTILRLFSSIDEELQLEVSNGSKKLLNRSIAKGEKVVKIFTKDMPIGITRFTIKNQNKIPIAERLVFLNKDRQLNIEISTDKENYETREKVTVHLKTMDKKGKPIPSNISLAVADNKLLSFADDKQDNILSYLLMSSELKGKIHKPIFYFNKTEPKATKALDYVMQTHGWRNYLTEAVITKNNVRFLPEQEDIHRGVVLNKSGKPVKAHLLLFDESGNKVLVFDTNDKGQYLCKLGKSRSYTLIAYTDTKESLRIVETASKRGYYASRHQTNNGKNTRRVKAFVGTTLPIKKPIKKKATASVTLDESSAALEEIVIVGYGIDRKKSLGGCISYIKSNDITENSNVIELLQGNVAGVSIVNADGIYGSANKIHIRGNATISGNNQPLFVIDGVVVSSESIMNMDTANIESITVLKDAAATSLYGSPGTNGVVVVSSKNKKHISNSWKKKLNNSRRYSNYSFHNIYNNNSITYYTPSQFYVPIYDSELVPQKRTDFRKTIYWNPVVQTDSKGEASLSFYNSDAITSFKITVEGIGYNGLVGRKEKDYSTKKLLSIDVKTPNYMALNDTVILPFTIKNESRDTITTTLGIIVPEGIEHIASVDNQIKIYPGTVLVHEVKVRPFKTMKLGTIRASVSTEQGYSDIVHKDISVISPYFPTETSISGSKNESFTFDVNHVVPGSVTANFKIYTDIVGDVMNGVESLIREPHGCFEQTSSSTYPNILVLKYLQETGKTNPAISKKAMHYIQEGYKRLISFETKEGGFEWFGHTPPHESLTAYGVLEFTEMKEIYPEVDQKMINRTVDWLLSRRDGKGGFKKSKKGYDSFASSPKEVADAYIVYAISEAVPTAAITKEYNATYTKALQTNDTYRMALLALSSFNLGKTDDSALLLSALQENIATHGFDNLPVENTITRSYANSKNIETVAFTLLALMRDYKKNELLITKGIEYLVSKRKNGRFGATQSTSIALKTLIEYTKRQKSEIINKDQTLKLTINGKELVKKLEINEKGQVVIQNLNSYIKEGEQQIEVYFSNPKQTFPYEMIVKWESTLPDTSNLCKMQLESIIKDQKYAVGDNVRMTVQVSNTSSTGVGLPMAIIGIPSGTTTQPWQLKELLEKKEVAYYEIFENYLVLYWREFAAKETKAIALDLKADIAGAYTAPASTTYLYYEDEYKHWIPGNTLEIGR